MKTIHPRLQISPSPFLKLSPPPKLAVLSLSMSSFNPALPEDAALVVAEVLRDQFNGLADMITAINAINAATVDGVTTVNPGDPAQVLLNLATNTLHFTFAIPQGFPGADGGTGPTGPQGPPFAQAVVDGVTTLPAGEQAWVSVGFDGTYVRFSFGIPQGEAGIQGPPGEVTSADLGNAINGTSGNSNAVPTMDAPFTNDPPTLADMETMRAAYNTLVLGLRRL